MPTLLATNALGTRVELVLDAPSSPGLVSIGEEAIDEILHWHDKLSLFQQHSLLSFINREAASRAVALDDDVFGLLSLCGRVHEFSNGAFDPTVRGCDASDGKKEHGENEAGWSALVELDSDRRTVRLTRPGVRLDLGGIAKGFALDMAAELLRSHLDCDALLHAGTSGVVVIGRTPRNIGVRSAGGVSYVTVEDASLCVSSHRGGRRSVDDPAATEPVTDDGTAGGSGCAGVVGGRDRARLSHIVAPGGLRKTVGDADVGTGAETSLVIGPSCAEADAWATALVVLGRRPSAMPTKLRSAVFADERWSSDGGVDFFQICGSEAE